MPALSAETSLQVESPTILINSYHCQRVGASGKDERARLDAQAEMPGVATANATPTVRGMTCESGTLYVSTSKKISFKQFLVSAVIGDEEIELTHRRQIAELIERHGWDGTCRVVPRTGGDGETIRIDERIAYGHLPENAAYWRVKQVVEGATLDAVGGARQFSDVLFGVSSKPLGKAAYDAIQDGRAAEVSLFAGLLAAGAGGDGAVLLEPDVIARMLREDTGGLMQGVYRVMDPQDVDAGRRVFERLAPEVREGVLRELMSGLPGGFTPRLASMWAKDPSRRGILIEQGSWEIVRATLERVVLDGANTEEFAKVLRGRSILGACRMGEDEAIEAAMMIPSLRVQAGEAAADFVKARLESTDPDVRREALSACWWIAAANPDAAAQLLATGLRDSDENVRSAAVSGTRRLAHIEGSRAVELLNVACEDPSEVVRMAVAHSVHHLVKTASDEAVRLVERLREDSSAGVRTVAIESIGELVTAQPLRTAELVAESVRDAGVASWSLPAFARSAPELATPLVREGLGSENGLTKLSAASAVREIAAHDAELGWELFETARRDADSEVRSRVLGSLGALAAHDQDRVLQVARQVLADRENTYREAAGMFLSLSSSAPGVAAQILPDGLRSDDPSVRFGAVSALEYIADADAELCAPLFKDAVGRLDGWLERYGVEGDVEELQVSLIEVVPNMLDSAREEVVELLGASLQSESMYVRNQAGWALLEVVDLPGGADAARAALADVPDRMIDDPEIRLGLGARGVIECEHPVVQDLINVWRIASLDEEGARELEQARTAEELLGVTSRYGYEPEMFDVLDDQMLDIDGSSYTTTVIRSRAELEQNARAMHNCTSGYSNKLSLGHVMVAVQDERGKPQYNAHLEPTPQGWVIQQVNGYRNETGEGCRIVESWLQGRLSDLPGVTRS